LDKVSKIFYDPGLTIYFANKHEKEAILRPLFSLHGVNCEAIAVDTDKFGTFSREVARTGGVRETLRKKILAATDLLPKDRLFLASEGSFIPHPTIGFIPTDLESLLLYDRTLDIEVYAEFLCLKPVHALRVFGPHDDIRKFLQEIQFPEHGVIVHPEHSLSPMFKGLHSELGVVQAMHDSLKASPTAKVVIETDLRACHNPTRRQAIFKAGQNLIVKLQSLCPSCRLPGFAISKGIPGLKCQGCGGETTEAKEVLLNCVKCSYSESRPRPDGKKSVDPVDCEYCNP